MARIAHVLGSFSSDSEAETFVATTGWSPADYSGMVSNTLEVGLKYLHSGTGLFRVWSGTQWVQESRSSSKVYVDSDFEGAVTAAGTTRQTLVIYKKLVVSANLTVPSNISLEFIKAGKLEASAGVTLTLANKPIATKVPIFSGAGQVLCSFSVYPEWFGVPKDGVADAAATLTKALASLPVGKTLRLSPGVYLCSTDLDIPDGVILKGEGGVLRPADTTTLTVSGRIDCPRIPLFDCSLCVTSGGVSMPFPGNGQGEWVVCVEWFGATLDGVTDDTDAWLFAIAALGPNTYGGIVSFGQGVSIISDTLEIPSRVTIEGIGREVSEIRYTGVSLAITNAESLFRYGGARDFTLSCTQDNPAVGGFSFDSLSIQTVFERLRIEGGGDGNGIHMRGGCYNSTWRDVSVRGFARGVFLEGNDTKQNNANRFISLNIGLSDLTCLAVHKSNYNWFDFVDIEGSTAFTGYILSITGDAVKQSQNNNFSNVRIGDCAGNPGLGVLYFTFAAFNNFRGLNAGVAGLQAVYFDDGAEDNRIYQAYFPQGTQPHVGAHADATRNVVFGATRYTDQDIGAAIDNAFLTPACDLPLAYQSLVEAFGGLGNSTTNDINAFSRLIASLDGVLGGGSVDLVPDKVYRVGGDLSFPATLRLRGLGGVIKPTAGSTVTILGDIEGGALQMFDRSAGGFFRLPSGVVARPEWFGESTTVQTSDATETTLVSHDIEDESVYLVEARVIARETDGSGRAVYGKVALVYRTGAGNATLEGAVGDLFSDIESVGGWDVTIDVDGANAFRVRVTGAVGDTIDWSGDVRFRALR